MNLRQIAEALAVPLPILATGRKGKPKLRVVRAKPVDTPKKSE
jgi:hypothetical protein